MLLSLPDIQKKGTLAHMPHQNRQILFAHPHRK